MQFFFLPKKLKQRFRMPQLASCVGAACILLTACGVGIPNYEKPDRDELIGNQADSWSQVPALRRIPVSADLFLSRSLRPPIPAATADKKIDLHFPNGSATLNDFVGILDLQDIPVVLKQTTISSGNIGSGSGGSTTRTAPAQPNNTTGSNSSSGSVKKTTSQYGNSLANTQPSNAPPSGEQELMNAVSQSTVTQSPAPSQDVSGLGAQRLPFRRFSGHIGDLVEKLNRSMDVVAWWESNALFISDRDQYVVSVPQHKEVIDAVSKELQSFGAEGITTSLYGGRIVYTARPQLNETVIKPYLRSLSGNLSEITLQLAVISLTLNEASERGFDWSSFQLQIGSSGKAIANSTTTTSGTTTTTGTTTSTGNLIGAGAGFLGTSTGGDITSSNRTAGSGQLVLSQVGTLAGNTLYGISGAIYYLSQFGKTQTKQMVELRTLAGMPVQLRSGSEIPYVKSIAATTTPGGTTAGNVSNSVETETVSTGLTLKMTPYFDSLMQLVVIDVSIEVAAVESFVTLSAGTGSSGLGSISQPIKNERSINDIVRIKAGETVILGGIREEDQSDNRTAPYGLFETLGGKQSTNKTVLNFYIMRPVVTFYEPVSASAMPRSEDEGDDTKSVPVPVKPVPVALPPTPPVVLPAPKTPILPPKKMDEPIPVPVPQTAPAVQSTVTDIETETKTEKIETVAPEKAPPPENSIEGSDPGGDATMPDHFGDSTDTP